MKTLTLDFETYDPGLKKFGAGWVFKYHYPEYEFELVGCGVQTNDKRCNYYNLSNSNRSWNEPYSTILSLINESDVLIFHNSLYDLGCLKYMYREELDLENKMIIDTMLMAKLYDQHIDEKYDTRSPYSLDTLCNIFNLVEKKEGDLLHNYAWISGMYQRWYLDKTGRNCHKRPSDKILHNFCMQDIRIFSEELISKYCLQDVKATFNLFEYLMPFLDIDLSTYSDILKVCLACKLNGIRIDLKKAIELSDHFFKQAELAEKEVIRLIKEIPVSTLFEEEVELNINSTKQLGEALIARGYDLPLTEKLSPSLKDAWLKEQTDPVFKMLRTYRKAHKVEKDFIQKVLKYQKAIPKKYRDTEYGWLYTSLKPLGATKSGRFTSGGGSGCLELSIHQIPRRDEEFGSPIRELFVAHPEEKLVCCDFSSQESRLQVHYASLLGCKGTEAIVDAWKADPNMKYHKKVAELTNTNYEHAKMINLGLSYDMHAKSLCRHLGTTEEEGMRILNQYHKLLPFMSKLQDSCAYAIKKRGYIRTIGGRKLLIDPSYVYKGRKVTKERKGLSKLIQGSAADQCIKAMISAYKLGLKILFSVHDEIIISTNSPEKDLMLLKQCMENSYELRVPVIADGGIGFSWGEAK